MRLPVESSFGDLRALLQEPPSAPAWELLCRLLDAWPEDDPELEVSALPYALQHTGRWPEALRAAPRAAVSALHDARAQPSLRIAHSLDTFSLGTDAWRALLLRDLPALSSLSVNTRNLRSHDALASWPALAHLQHLSIAHTVSARWLNARSLPALRSLDESRLRDQPQQLVALHHELPPLHALTTRASAAQALWQLRSPDRRAALRELTLHVEPPAQSGGGAHALLQSLRHERDDFSALTALDLHGLHAEPGQLASILPPGLQRLAIIQTRVPAQDWTTMLSHPHDSLRELHLWTALEGDATRQLAALSLPALHKLTLTAPRIAPAQLAALLRSDWFPRLESLQLTGQQLDAALLRALPAMPRLTELVLADCAISPDALAALMEGGRLPALTRLELTDLPLAMTDALTLAKSPTSAHLTELALRACRISSDQLMAMTSGPWPRLTSLDLRATPLSADHLATLHAAPLTRALRLLQLDAPAAPEATHLATDPTLAPLVRFALWRP